MPHQNLVMLCRSLFASLNLGVQVYTWELLDYVVSICLWTHVIRGTQISWTDGLAARLPSLTTQLAILVNLASENWRTQ